MHAAPFHEPRKSTFSVDDIPVLSGKVIIVTGANTGVGKETVKALLAHNAKVYIAVRSQEKAEEAIKDLREETGKDAHFLKLDLADLKSIEAAVKTFTSQEKELHVLYNNAGVMGPPIDQVTAQGYNLQFGVHVLGPFSLTKLLLPTLIATAKSSPDGKVRVINTSSSLHLLGNLNYNKLKDGPARRKSSSLLLYCQSKYATVILSSELARRYGDQGIVSVCLNPGTLHSGLQRHLNKVQYAILNLILYPTPFGALSGLWAGTSVDGANLNGKYVVPWARLGSPRANAQAPATGEKLWEWMEEQIHSTLTAKES